MSEHARRQTTYDAEAARPTRVVAVAVGVVFLAVGVLGFVPGVTTNTGDLQLAGHESGAELLGIFQVSVLHNVVHLLYGVVALVVAARPMAVVFYLWIGGFAYLALWIYGLAVPHGHDANVVPLNDADNWLHLALGVAMVGLAYVLHRRLRGGVTLQSPT